MMNIVSGLSECLLFFSEGIQVSSINAVCWHTCLKRFITCNMKGIKINVLLLKKMSCVWGVSPQIAAITSGASFKTNRHDRSTLCISVLFLVSSNWSENEEMSLCTCALWTTWGCTRKHKRTQTPLTRYSEHSVALLPKTLFIIDET